MRGSHEMRRLMQLFSLFPQMLEKKERQKETEKRRDKETWKVGKRKRNRGKEKDDIKTEMQSKLQRPYRNRGKEIDDIKTEMHSKLWRLYLQRVLCSLLKQGPFSNAKEAKV